MTANVPIAKRAVTNPTTVFTNIPKDKAMDGAKGMAV
jgi:hypothetical protein